MARVWNFSAGPSGQPEWVLKKAADEMLSWHGCGMGVMEMSHRGKEFDSIIVKAEADCRKLLNIPDNYKVIFHEGGAHHMFSAIPFNLLGGEKKEADYIVTGTWSNKACNEAKKYGTINIAAKPEKFNQVPKEYKFNPNAAYVYYCDNETIEGVEYKEPPETHGVPLVADMSSNLFSKKLDVSKFGIIYACAQKNFGAAGMTLMIIRDDLLKIPPHPLCPTIMRFDKQAENRSMLNTPSTYCIYIAGLIFEWLLDVVGGMDKMEEINRKKAQKLYEYIDSSDYYTNPVEKANRSCMNVPFIGKHKDLEKQWLAEAAKEGLVQLAGHRSVGGFRASIYNAMTEEGVDKLIAFMKKFAEAHP